MNDRNTADELTRIRDQLTHADLATGTDRYAEVIAFINAAIATLQDLSGTPPKAPPSPPKRTGSRIAGALDNAGTSTDGVTVGKTRRSRST